VPFLSKTPLPILFQRSVLHQLGCFPAGDDADHESPINAMIEITAFLTTF
jgi:hypothetical protein